MMTQAHFVLAAAALGFLTLAVAGPPSAPPTLRTDTPGSAFRVVQGRADTDDVPDGRRIRGAEHAEVTLAGELRMPPVTLTDRRAARLVLHFRTSHHGPTLRKVVLPDGNAVDMSASGNQMDDGKVNTLDFGDVPLNLYDHAMLKLVIAFPGGIDSHVDPGVFVLKSVSLDALRKPGAGVVQAAHAMPPLAQAHQGTPAAPPSSVSLPMFIFDKPTLDVAGSGMRRLDWCRVSSSQCGRAAADMFCATKRFRRASRFEAEGNVGETVTIESGELCSGPACVGFASIRCE